MLQCYRMLTVSGQRKSNLFNISSQTAGDFFSTWKGGICIAYMVQ